MAPSSKHDKICELFHELHELPLEDSLAQLDAMDLPADLRAEVEELLRVDLESKGLGRAIQDLVHHTLLFKDGSGPEGP